LLARQLLRVPPSVISSLWVGSPSVFYIRGMLCYYYSTLHFLIFITLIFYINFNHLSNGSLFTSHAPPPSAAVASVAPAVPLTGAFTGGLAKPLSLRFTAVLQGSPSPWFSLAVDGCSTDLASHAPDVPLRPHSRPDPTSLPPAPPSLSRSQCRSPEARLGLAAPPGPKGGGRPHHPPRLTLDATL
jgi:hypothetical protein